MPEYCWFIICFYLGCCCDLGGRVMTRPYNIAFKLSNKLQPITFHKSPLSIIFIVPNLWIPGK